MKKILLLTLALLTLYGCAPSPMLVSVNGKKLDASEYAFYLNYQLMSVEKPEELTGEEVKTIKDEALKQMINNEIILQKCKEFDLKLSKEEKKKLKDLKKDFVDSLGGSAKYLSFLKQSAMTDHIYDKSQSNIYYHNMLMAYLTENPEKPESIGFTDESLRKYFSENYLKIKYIYMSLMDENGNNLVDEAFSGKEQFIKVVAEGSKLPEKDFDVLIEKYNDDEAMRLEPEGFVYGKKEIEKNPIYANALTLKENEVGGPYRSENGYYIIKRIPVDAGYFDAHHEEILSNAIDKRFAGLMDIWKGGGKIKMTDLYDKIDLNNYMLYVK